MNTLEEIIYYCNEKEPAGALMISGEWGCGKTYLIEHEVKEVLKDTHILVRVSLFGIDSIEALHTAVKKQWLSDCWSLVGKVQKHKGSLTAGKTVLSTAGNIIGSVLPYVKEVTGAALSLNLLDFITITNEVGKSDSKKKVVLIFDDLERSKLGTVNVLGCINEYCENQRFSTIIIANEDRINPEDINEVRSKISYSEIKEKIVTRTIHYHPDYEKIIHSVIEGCEWSEESYRKFLLNNEPLILGVFERELAADGEEAEKPHNIRSLKCALQDFYRIYQGLAKSDIEQIDRYLYTFIAYTLAARYGVAEEGTYGYLFSDEEVKKLYPFFSSSMLIGTSREWILYGEWDSVAFERDIQLLKERSRKMEPREILRNSRFQNLEENQIQAGFSGLLQDCYAGVLSLNEYVLFINNSYISRLYGLELPENADWDKICTGIQKRFETNICEHDDEGHSYLTIGSDTRTLYTEDELRAYDLIYDFRHTDQMILQTNERGYIAELKTNGVDAFITFRNKRFTSFTKEMAEAVAYCFDHCNQVDKCAFSGYFEDMWKTVFQRNDTKQEETMTGFLKLISLLGQLKNEYADEERKIASVHAETLIRVIKGIIGETEGHGEEGNEE